MNVPRTMLDAAGDPGRVALGSPVVLVATDEMFDRSESAPVNSSTLQITAPAEVEAVVTVNVPGEAAAWHLNTVRRT
jgi:hypothetical protein